MESEANEALKKIEEEKAHEAELQQNNEKRGCQAEIDETEGKKKKRKRKNKNKQKDDEDEDTTKKVNDEVQEELGALLGQMNLGGPSKK